MASVTDVLRLRRLTGEPTDETYTNVALSTMIDELGVEAAAAQVWEEKAAAYAGLVDVSEGSSNRRMSQLHSQALAMASRFRSIVSVEASAAPRSRPIIRG